MESMKEKVGNWVVRKSGEPQLIWDDEMEQAVAFLVSGNQLVDDDTRAQNALEIIMEKIGVQLSLDELRADMEEEGRKTGFFPATAEPPASQPEAQQAAPGPGPTEPGPQPPPLPTEEMPEPPPDPQPPPFIDPPVGRAPPPLPEQQVPPAKTEPRKGGPTPMDPPPNEEPPEDLDEAERPAGSAWSVLAAFAAILGCLGLCFVGYHYGPSLMASLSSSPSQVNEPEIEMPVIPVSTATEDGLASSKRTAAPTVTTAGLPGYVDCQVGRFSVQACDIPRGCSVQYLPDTAPRRLLVTCEGGHQYVSELQMGEGKPWDAGAFRAGARRLQFVTYN